MQFYREGVRGVALATPFFSFMLQDCPKKFYNSFLCKYYRLHQSEIPNALPGNRVPAKV